MGKKTLTRSVLIAIGFVIALFATATQAAVVYGDFRTYIAGYSGSLAPGWTYSTEGGTTLALRAKNRYDFSVPDGSDGVYELPLGVYPGSTGGRQYASYEFSVSSVGLVSYLLYVDHDPTSAMNFTSVNPFSYWTDNVGFSNINPDFSLSIGFQNSQNIGFPDTPGGPFDPMENGLYTFRLEAYRNRALVNSVEIDVQVGDAQNSVPEPGTLALIAPAFAAMIATASRRKKFSQ